MHEAINIGLPLLTILGGILLNRSNVKELRAEISRRFDVVDARTERMEARFGKRFDAMESRFDKRFDTVDAELRYFHGEIGNTRLAST